MIYTRNNLGNSGDLSTADRILFFIKAKGPVSTATLAQALDMTAEAARQQVKKLLALELIEGRQETASGVGRPRQTWGLTEAGNSRFPDAHASLTVQLIDSVRQIFGEDGLDRLIAQREEKARTTYRQACTASSLRERLEQLAAIRTIEGYMAHIEHNGTDWLLIENHCPICAAARACQGFCRSELQLFQEIVGQDGTVSRERHLLTGSSRCVYRIVQTEAG